MIIYDTISLWLGRATIAAGSGWLAWQVVAVLCLATRDTYTTIRNVLDDAKEWWRWFGLPSCFLANLWRQTDARWHGYETRTLRRKAKSQNHSFQFSAWRKQTTVPTRASGNQYTGNRANASNAGKTLPR